MVSEEARSAAEARETEERRGGGRWWEVKEDGG